MKNKKLLFVTLLFSFTATLLAQVHNNGIPIYVGDNAEFSINDAFNFTTSSTKPQTSRTASFGKVSISALALSVSSNSALNYVNGYVNIYPGAGAAFYKFPIGFGETYGPIGIFASNSQQIASAYFLGNATSVATTLDSEVEKISDFEYWKFASTNEGKVTLYWNEESSFSTVLDLKPMEYLTIVGYNGTKWVALPAQLNIQLHSITTNESLNLSLYSAFAIGARKDLICYPPIQSSGIVKTWNGTYWYPSDPGITDPVVIAASLSLINNLACYSVTLNENITMTAGKQLMVVNGFDGPGKVIMSNLASIVQQNPTAVAPKIEMTRIATQMKRFDYAFLSNPITDVSVFFGQVLNNQNVATNGNFGVQPNSAFLQLRTLDLAGMTAIDASASNTAIGRGFSATVRSQTPYSTSNTPESWFTQKEDVHIKIDGLANNGRYTLTLPSTNGYMQLGNPYPSPIDIRKIWELTEGLVDKTAYYWTYNTPLATIATDQYNKGDFATYNLEGGTASSLNGVIPDGSIVPMNSILIKSIAPTAAIIIDNCVRLFAPPIPQNPGSMNGKFRLNLQGSQNSFSQILISYNSDKGTLGYDNGYDSQRFVGTLSELSSLINTEKFTIQTRPAFTIQDIVPLHFDKRTNETFAISLATMTGIFETTPVILHDKTLQIYHNLSANSYSFTPSATADEMRFEITYDSSLLQNSDFKLKEAFAYISQNQFRAQANVSISDIQIYDMAGRLIATYLNINTKNFSSNFDNAKGIYIAKIKLENGTIVNQKLANQ